jgi:predicted secreted Zn-dependent protease
MPLVPNKKMNTLLFLSKVPHLCVRSHTQPLRPGNLTNVVQNKVLEEFESMKRIVLFLLIAMTGLSACGSEGTQAIAAAPGSAAAPVAVTEQYEYYYITGNSETELRQQMAAQGIKWDDGKTYDALTTWNVKWDYGYNCGNAGCTVSDFNAAVAITFRYPSWMRTEAAPQDLTLKWDAYMRNLIVHENGHRDMAVQQTEELAAAVAQLPPAPSRGELARQVEQLASAKMAKMNTDQREYDAITIHGTTQGAVFP